MKEKGSSEFKNIKEFQKKLETQICKSDIWSFEEIEKKFCYFFMEIKGELPEKIKTKEKLKHSYDAVKEQVSGLSDFFLSHVGLMTRHGESHVKNVIVNIYRILTHDEKKFEQFIILKEEDIYLLLTGAVEKLSLRKDKIDEKDIEHDREVMDSWILFCLRQFLSFSSESKHDTGLISVHP